MMNKIFMVGACGATAVVPFAIGAVIGSLLIPYVANFWLAFAGLSCSLTWWMGALLGIIPHLGFGSVAAAIITFVVSCL